MTRNERFQKILQILELKQASSVNELSKELDVSHMTVRRDLLSLAEEELVKMMHGGVFLNPENETRSGEERYSLIAAGAKCPEQKKSIGKLAASLVESEDILIIDSGSTTEYLAKFLPDDKSFIVMSYALNILRETVRRENVKSVFSGGVFHENTLMFESPEGLDMIRRFRATKGFFSCAGASDKFGVTCMNQYEHETKVQAMKSSMKKILLADSTKFGIVGQDFFAELSGFDLIITDDNISCENVNMIQEKGIELLVARNN